MGQTQKWGNFPEWLVFNVIKNARGETQYHLAIFSDISERKASAERIEFLTYHDPLTNLANRTTLTNQLNNCLATAQQQNTKTALLLINLDHFTNINLTFGLAAGDMALRSVARHLQSCLHHGEVLARLNGDEFAILAPTVKSPDTMGHLAETILNSVNNLFNSDEYEFNLSASIGIGIFPDDATTIDDLFSITHTSLEHAKRSGGKTYKFATQDMQKNVRMRLMLENRVSKAINNESLELHYQPLINLETGRICGLEALARWDQSEKNPLSPGEFIPIAEDIGLIIPLTNWALTQACRDYIRWAQQGLSPPPISVNISAVYFTHPDFQKNVMRIIATEGVNPSCLKFELTETTVMQNIESARKVFADLKAAGIHIVIDDFGTGYSSLSYIKYFAFDQFKIDLSFIRDIENSEDARIIILAIINLAKSLNMSVVAEGVETAAQLEFLRKNHCDMAQGFYFSKAQPPATLVKLLQNDYSLIK